MITLHFHLKPQYKYEMNFTYISQYECASVKKSRIGKQLTSGCRPWLKNLAGLSSLFCSLVSHCLSLLTVDEEKQGRLIKQWKEYVSFYPIFRKPLPLFIRVSHTDESFALNHVKHTLIKKGSAFRNIG